jgi:hypothetical protein
VGAGERYRITVRGRLSGRFSSAFPAGLVLEAGAGTSALVGVIEDQSELFGVLDRIRDLGLELVGVEALSG